MSSWTIKSNDSILVQNNTFTGTNTFNGAVTFKAGTGSGTYQSSGTISVGTTPVGNVGVGEDDLMTYTLPLNSLSAAGKGFRVTAWGTGANNANAKTVSLYVGGTQINTGTLVANQANVWESEIYVFSTGTDTQRYFSKLARVSATAVDVTLRTQGTLTIDDGAAIIIKYTGTATSNDDVTQAGMIIEFFN